MNIYSVIHITTKNNIDTIIQDGYLYPSDSGIGLGKGVFCIILKKKDDWKKIPLIFLFGSVIIELDKNILNERNDFIIREEFNEGNLGSSFGGPIVYNGDRNNLDKVIKNLTTLNEVIFKNKISLKKYLSKVNIINQKDIQKLV